MSNARGTPSAGALNTPGVGKIGDFRPKSPFISEKVQDRTMVAMER